MKNLRLTKLLAPGLAGLLLVLSACGGGSSAPEGGIGGSGIEGTLRMSITDAPACGFDAVNITVESVRVNQNAAAGDNDAGWVDIVLPTPQKIDLLSLTNGVLFTLGETPLAAGTYTQMRLVLASNDASDPLANSVVPTGGSEVPLTTPSGQESGLKANIDIPVAANQLADFVIDFDACRSVVTAGNSGKYLLKPVIDVVPDFISGVSGYVDTSIADGDTLVSLEQAGVVVKSTVPDATGSFLLEPVAPGTYDLVVTAPGRASAVVTGVVVSDSLVTILDDASTPIMPPDALAGTIDGTVTAVAPIDATLSATQTLTMGDLVTIAALPADSVTGDYTFTLPVAAPVVAPYVANAAPVFAADVGAAGSYGLVAASGSSTQTAGPFALSAGATITQDFTFP